MTPDERAAIRAEAFREAAEIALQIAMFNGFMADGKRSDYTPGERDLRMKRAGAREVADAIEARAKEKQP